MTRAGMQCEGTQFAGGVQSLADQEVWDIVDRLHVCIAIQINLGQV